MFDAAFRVAFENNAKPGLEGQLVTELHALDREAVRLRKAGMNPIDELRERVDMLRANVSRIRGEQIAENGKRLDQFKVEWSHRREKNPSAELMRQNDARLRVNALTDGEVDALAIAYVDGADLDLPTLREIQSRARQTDDLAHLVESLHTEMAERRAETPWISENEDATKLADEIDDLSTTTLGCVRFEADDATVVVQISDLVDYNAELAAPV